MNQPKFIILLIALIFTQLTIKAQKKKHGLVTTNYLASSILNDTKTGLDSNRMVKVYLPPGYSDSGKSYPVIYYLHNIFSSAENTLSDGRFVSTLERGFENGIVKELIVVIADFSSPTTGSLYENSQTSGRWLDFITDELVPFIDARFRTIHHRDSRALTGDFMGARGALKLSMTNPEIFSVVYALHPVATGVGYIPWSTNEVNWKKILQAKTFSELAGDGRAQIFVAIAQAFLPNPNRPPFYCDFWMELENGEPKIHVENTLKAQVGFLLDQTVVDNANNLKKMNGIAFDWGRYDPTQTHVYTNQAFTRRLEDLGIDHEAEEYRGTPRDKNWIDNGRVYTRMLPFINRRLVFELQK